MSPEIQDWTFINKVVIERKFLNIDNYEFGSKHLFGEIQRLKNM
jgi:hypothetical protein